MKLDTISNKSEEKEKHHYGCGTVLGIIFVFSFIVVVINLIINNLYIEPEISTWIVGIIAISIIIFLCIKQKRAKNKIDELTKENSETNIKIENMNKESSKADAKIKSLRTANTDLKRKADLNLTVSQMKPVELDELINKKTKKVDGLDKELTIKTIKQSRLNETIDSLNKKIKNLNSEIIDLSDEVTYESYGLYKPHYDFVDSVKYKDKLSKVRNQQKILIHNNIAGRIFKPMTLDGSETKGKSLQKKNIKQLLRTFNGECEAAINKVTKSNIATVEKKINSSFTQLNKLNEPNGVYLNEDYLNSKLDEAHIALEYALKKEAEKEELREQREREREEKKLQREIASERAKYEKDETHFSQAKDRISKKLESTSDTAEVLALKHELQELQDKLDNIRKQKEKLEDRAANLTAGYVYIISNIGSFGKDVYKIGVTRRLEPMDRINELGSASVPFKFDVNALVFSDDAFKLEAELHRRFDNERVNRVNKRKEYFKIPMDELKKVLNEHKELTFNFNEYPDAYEYRDTLYIEQHEKNTNTQNK
ncbi:DUF4041 domain-containing protein [Lactobacillus sp. ESL0731]|uniref:DUF4041 domain-containing protein n=1 Tax=unclassified Lactobacillus TaxID=2620435 RepID=UPI0023F67842|nr:MULTISPECIES: DUF4041 domain-containing protein [unclassified Lactobacillus]WEV51636.1 DUF4041 domain-containing protein [Lactobacillus sp. ESL0700]WEV62765.1 DUF4041 domain-containing protein [Lactobacillus sp. ESL0731]